MSDYQDHFMLEAIEEAKKALNTFEVPVGCVFVDPKTNQIIARGHNLTNARKNALEHAELVAIGKYSDEQQQNENENKIRGSHLYVTVEPCIMCAAALLYHRVGKVFFGCKNPRFGGNGTILSLHDDHQGEIWNDNKNSTVVGYESVSGFHEEEAIRLLQEFYEQENPSAPQPKSKEKRRQRVASNNNNNAKDDDDEVDNKMEKEK